MPMDKWDECGGVVEAIANERAEESDGALLRAIYNLGKTIQEYLII